MMGFVACFRGDGPLVDSMLPAAQVFEDVYSAFDWVYSARARCAARADSLWVFAEPRSGALLARGRGCGHVSDLDRLDGPAAGRDWWDAPPAGRDSRRLAGAELRQVCSRRESQRVYAALREAHGLSPTRSPELPPEPASRAEAVQMLLELAEDLPRLIELVHRLRRRAAKNAPFRAPGL
jgi:hypothetical protein